MGDPLATLGRNLEWCERGTAFFEGCLRALPDAALDAPSLLPGWSRRHVAAHVAFNARALGRLLHWARTGEETPMYPPGDARDREIEEGARLGAPALRRLVAETAGDLAAAVRDLPEAAWANGVRTRTGIPVPAAAVPWMRTREVWIHAVDLGGGATFADLPPDLLDALIDDVISGWGNPPALVVAPSDRPWDRRTGPAGAAPVTVTGTAAALAAALTGRDISGVASPDGPVPTLPGWL
ncbi:maleylpyruvate isomerase family mycothiol-dependent enzyme [Bailinhaonella thermotolerans]|uniref:Maleylpyruvate isomerase family mycothiol-dependent enzyme n=1 Tax=Bailinhaonella thermotolerans TaxID=1070861 RepID=A0A3A4A9U4_9ACTN|nr:maleylpyruvate isomerase family mycothiol-dependent enzyme [Bailinhaonella thermotolerans]RJL24809.1 maleylpyruvate isomerase family mycothiol-dependent enzyme [Bailinhaonella thermotolerans]